MLWRSDEGVRLASMVRAGVVLALTGVLAACGGGYTETTSPCAGTTAMAFHAGPGPEVATRRAGPGCAFTAVGAP